ncbi:MAG TPA: cytochrome P450 [Acidimicrobiales bacterium]|jgi:cytochrome P450|nr:cytochrome P450 [Acidimicrobiales bacterium]
MAMTEDLPAGFDPLQQPETAFVTARALLERCPFGWSERDGGFWVAAGREPALGVLQDREGFHVGGPTRAVRIPPDPVGFNRPLMPPQDVNPPIHRDFRALINPHVSPSALVAHAEGFRRIIAELVEAYVARMGTDFARDVAKVFPARVTFSELFGIPDRDEAETVRSWVERIIYGRFTESGEVLGALQGAWNDWTVDFMARRRRDRRNNVVDALLFGRVQGRPPTEIEIVGALQVLILGGFMTTSDASCNMVITLVDHPELEHRLRERPELIDRFIEEVLRLDPPVGARVRRCTHETTIDGHVVHEGDRVLVNLVAANRDPAEFDRPEEFDLDRPRNRHLAFGAGIHRCVGSNVARLTLRILMEELLARATDFRFPVGRRETRVGASGATWRLVDSVPLEFRPTAGSL